MRTTINLADDVAAAVERERRGRNAGLSEVVNDLIRRGLRAPAPGDETPASLPAWDLGVEIDVSNVQAVLDELDGPDAR